MHHHQTLNATFRRAPLQDSKEWLWELAATQVIKATIERKIGETSDTGGEHTTSTLLRRYEDTTKVSLGHC